MHRLLARLRSPTTGVQSAMKTRSSSSQLICRCRIHNFCLPVPVARTTGKMDHTEETSEIYGRWDDGFVIRRMRRDDEPQVISWFDSRAFIDLQVTLDMRREDASVGEFYVGELEGELAASLVVTSVADDLKVPGFAHVVEKYRRSLMSGFLGRMMTIAADFSKRRNWSGIVSVDTSQHFLVSLFEQFAFKTSSKTTRYEGTVSTSHNRGGLGTDTREVSEAEFDRLMSYDDKCFIRPGSAWRRELMSRWIKTPGGKAVMAVSQQGDVVGYGCRRPAVSAAERHFIGPLYADSYVIAADLLQQLTCDIVGKRIRIYVTEANEEAVRLVREMQLENTDVLPMIRMYRNGQSQATSCPVFAITSGEICGF